ncbi:hypothetical protein Acsp06_39090 [Actinomycetospora sp. NBRC 106375]|uniref:DUF1707 SHOCT-like domain-containing protein n=1 Tax=Actinomycetospora sp. NBRC 106375 TaxID=3032207 RepID=UPI0024A30F4D|nr:DUF1707 domain-containing protein [Actinomycetospora sp. NBRC 106375]GLZ47724.1 hypothetical protein Acsp06_39090 [Actinomycetospora sp. NBRC 106375]
MTQPEPRPSPRIGTAEREAAMKALDAHLEAGRLDPEEYGERSAKVTEARTAEDLEPLFVDLPEPHRLSAHGAVAAREDRRPAAAAPPGAPARREPSALARYGPAVSAALPIIALILFFTVPIANSWVFFLLIPLGGALFARSRQEQQGDDRDT